MAQEHGPRVHVEQPQWEYVIITQKNSGQVGVMKPDGNTDVIGNQHILATLNDFGNSGWELVYGGPNPDSSGSTYTMKRRKA